VCHVGAPVAAGAGKGYLLKDDFAQVAAPESSWQGSKLDLEPREGELAAAWWNYQEELVLWCQVRQCPQQALQVLATAGARLIQEPAIDGNTHQSG
jgi:hypothetical protein